jgi:regulator of protease activity HflC (stomatin/prohibitin superfamily)
MGRSIDQVIASIPETRRARVEARAQELKDEVQSLGELRRAAGKAQTDIASALKIKQPSVSKIEQQADMYLSTLRSYVEAMGGELELTVKLPSRPLIHLRSLGDVLPSAVRPLTRRK